MILDRERRKKSREERKRDKEKDKERENAGAWAPKAFCSPFTVQYSRTRKIRGVRERTRTPRWGEDNEWRGCEEGERERSKEAREREREREREMDTIVRPFWSRCKLERPLETQRNASAIGGG